MVIFIDAILISFAGVCKAVADTIAHHLDTSIFRHSNFWVNGGKIIFGKYKFDGWHIANSLMIMAFITAICFPADLQWYWIISGGGLIFNLTFNLFYNRILKL
jgi:hypothetical protein